MSGRFTDEDAADALRNGHPKSGTPPTHPAMKDREDDDNTFDDDK